MPPGTLEKLALALDDIRELGRLDLELNHPRGEAKPAARRKPKPSAKAKAAAADGAKDAPGAAPPARAPAVKPPVETPRAPEEPLQAKMLLKDAESLFIEGDAEGARALLERVIAEYPETPSAAKAREYVEALD